MSGVRYPTTPKSPRRIDDLRGPPSRGAPARSPTHPRAACGAPRAPPRGHQRDSRPERNVKPRLARKLYRRRYLVEIFFHNLKRFRAIATRYDKTARNYLALVQLACARL
ncbi:MAG TPA: transposase [Polyangiaceae bacterium]|nr:transposase [Polyangiaceae bacterium]